jgi:membrane-bound lytic murein transglycosylase D
MTPQRFALALGGLALLVLSGCATAPPAASPSAPAPTAALPPSASLPPAAPPAAPVAPPAAQPASVAPEAAAPALPATPPPPKDLWERIRNGFGMPDLQTDLVRDREQWYASRPEYVRRMTERSRRYLFYIVEELEKRRMPSEIALLPYIESAFNPLAMSHAKASGMWQFIPSTGRDYALTQNLFRDERRDVLESTKAALDYLQKLHRMFGDWHLALAAYNWGEGSVSRAIARNQRAGLPTDYASLTMPMETRMYVPKLQAVKNIIARPQAWGIALPVIENHPYFTTVTIRRDIDVSLAARLANLKIEDFKALNPSMNKPVILAMGTPTILLPWDNADIFSRNLDSHSGQMASWTAWLVPGTMRVADAAKRVGMSELQLREVNRIPPRHLIKAGSTILVPRSEGGKDVPDALADNAQLSTAPEGGGKRKAAHKGPHHSATSPKTASASSGGPRVRQAAKKSGVKQAAAKPRTSASASKAKPAQASNRALAKRAN